MGPMNNLSIFHNSVHCVNASAAKKFLFDTGTSRISPARCGLFNCPPGLTILKQVVYCRKTRFVVALHQEQHGTCCHRDSYGGRANSRSQTADGSADLWMFDAEVCSSLDCLSSCLEVITSVPTRAELAPGVGQPPAFNRFPPQQPAATSQQPARGVVSILLPTP